MPTMKTIMMPTMMKQIGICVWEHETSIWTRKVSQRAVVHQTNAYSGCRIILRVSHIHFWGN